MSGAGLLVGVAALALALAAPASADTRLTIGRAPNQSRAMKIGTPTSGGQVVRSSLDPEGRKLVIEIAGTRKRSAAVTVPIDLPPGTRITAMTFALGAHEPLTAAFVDANIALADYERSIRITDDPALLQHVWTSPDAERFALHVFPVSRTDHATVEITLDVPTDTRADWMTSDPAPRKAVASDLSLYATVPPPSVIIIGCGGYADNSRTIDHKIIRRRVRLAEARLSNCWRHELFAAPTLQGTAELHFAILPSGETANVSVDGSLESDAVRQCIAQDVATWQWPETDGTTVVNYPLTFQVAGE